MKKNFFSQFAIACQMAPEFWAANEDLWYSGSQPSMLGTTYKNRPVYEIRTLCKNQLMLQSYALCYALIKPPYHAIPFWKLL